jgi:hypothetical protein
LPYNLNQPESHGFDTIGNNNGNGVDAKLPASAIKFLETKRETLYDLKNDPGEMVNLATDPKFKGDLDNCRIELTD